MWWRGRPCPRVSWPRLHAVPQRGTFTAMTIPLAHVSLAMRRSAAASSLARRPATFASCPGGQLGWGFMSSIAVINRPPLDRQSDRQAPG